MLERIREAATAGTLIATAAAGALNWSTVTIAASACILALLSFAGHHVARRSYALAGVPVGDWALAASSIFVALGAAVASFVLGAFSYWIWLGSV